MARAAPTYEELDCGGHFVSPPGYPGPGAAVTEH